MTKSVLRRSVVAVAILMAGQGAASAAPAAPSVTRPVQATKFDTNPARTYAPPSLAVDPENSLNVVAQLAEVRTNRCGLIRSTDGGTTWTHLDASPSLPSFPFCLMTNAVTQGRVAFGRNHTLYYLLDGWDTQDGANNRSVLLGRSTDFGATWATTVVSNNQGKSGAAAFTDKPVTGLGIDTTSGNDDIVYVGWRRQFPNASSDVPAQPMIAISSDGGRSFGTPMSAVAGVFDNAAARAPVFKTTSTTAPVPAPDKPVDAAVNFGGVNPRIVVSNHGTVYVMWIATTANIPGNPALAHYLSKSTDHGRTWTVLPINDFSPNNTDNYEVQLAWSPQGGPDGTLHLVYEGTDKPTIAGWTQIYHRRSTDGGRTWSPNKAVNDDDPAQLLVDRIPDVRTAPNGRVDVAWWSSRDNPGMRSNDVYYAFSSDDGATWSKNIRVTDRPVDRTIGPFGNNFDLWGPPGLVSTNAYALFAWDDTRNGDKLTQTQDIYAAAVQHRAIAGGTSRAARYALAAAGSLAILGLVLLGAVMVSRRRRGDRVPAAAIAKSSVGASSKSP